MFLLDTNVVAELRKANGPNADRNVIAWSAKANAAELFISTISIMQLEQGILLIERQDSLQGGLLRQWLDNHVLKTFAARTLPIDTAVAQCCARLHVPDPRAERDALICATALVHRMTIVKRNVSDFTSMGVRLINPWAS